MELRSRGLNNRPCAGRVDVLWEWGNEENEKEPTVDESLLHNSRDSSRHGLLAIPSIFLLPFNLACHLDGSTDGEETGRQRERERARKKETVKTTKVDSTADGDKQAARLVAGQKTEQKGENSILSSDSIYILIPSFFSTRQTPLARFVIFFTHATSDDSVRLCVVKMLGVVKKEEKKSDDENESSLLRKTTFVAITTVQMARM